MSEQKMMRLNQAVKKLNVGLQTCVEFLKKKGYDVEASPNAKITMEQFDVLSREFADSAMEKEEASHLTIGQKHSENVVIDTTAPADAAKKSDDEEILIKNVSPSAQQAEKKEEKSPASSEPAKAEPKEEPKEEAPKPEDPGKIEAPKLTGPKVLGKIDLDALKKGKGASKPEEKKQEALPKEETPKEVTKPEEKAKAEKEPVKSEEKAELAKPTPQEPVKAEESKKEPVKAETPEAPAPAAKKEEKPAEEKAPAEEQKVIRAEADKLPGLNVLGKIELPATPDRKKQRVASSDSSDASRNKKRRKRKVVSKDGAAPGAAGAGAKKGGGTKPPTTGRKPQKEEPTEKEIQEQIKATLARLSQGKSGTGRSKYKKEKRSAAEAKRDRLQDQEDLKLLKVTEFISANDLASLMDVNVNEIIAKGLSMGMFISINQRLDAESITILADEFGYDVEFTSTEDEVIVQQEQDAPEDLEDRAPIVTIMGHVDHGKTSLLDYIRSSRVASGEAGGITQHIGAYDVNTDSGRRIAFLDTPGHEAFTAMRARGAKITDVAIIVVAADDAVMPQTKEAINHAQVAGVPIVIAINKIDRPNSNPEKIKEQLANINILVEDWGGKYQCQEISAKTGQGIEELLEKVLLEAELLELKANPNKAASGTVVEASLDKGRGYVSTIMVENGTLRIGDILLAGHHFGRVKAMFNHKGERLKVAPPATPVQMLGLGGAPQAGDKFNVMETEREARELANKREQILREQSLRTKKHITLDEIGRRLAIGSFKELNLIVKGDVDGSVEALSDSLLKLSNDEVKVNIIHKGVGQISESDVLLASASDAIIVAFQVRPSTSARKLAEQEEIEIRMFSIIYDAINVIKDAIEGMLSPEVEEVITGTAEIREIFKISKIGTVAGCMVVEGKIERKNQIRLIRDGIVIYTGDLGALKRFKDDVNEVRQGFDCGMSIKNFNDMKVGDLIEGFTMKETKRKL